MMIWSLNAIFKSSTSYMTVILSYLWKNQKESEASWAYYLEFASIEENMPLPAQMKRFWECTRNKENLQVLSRIFFRT